jgi:hypothetical protein
MLNSLGVHVELVKMELLEMRRTLNLPLSGMHGI